MAEINPEMRAQQAQAAPAVVHTYQQTQYVVNPTPGGFLLSFGTMHGEVHQFMLNSKAAKAIGSALLAPSVALPGDPQVNGTGG